MVRRIQDHLYLWVAGNQRQCLRQCFGLTLTQLFATERFSAFWMSRWRRSRHDGQVRSLALILSRLMSLDCWRGLVFATDLHSQPDSIGLILMLSAALRTVKQRKNLCVLILHENWSYKTNSGAALLVSSRRKRCDWTEGTSTEGQTLQSESFWFPLQCSCLRKNDRLAIGRWRGFMIMDAHCVTKNGNRHFDLAIFCKFNNHKRKTLLLCFQHLSWNRGVMKERGRKKKSAKRAEDCPHLFPS